MADKALLLAQELLEGCICECGHWGHGIRPENLEAQAANRLAAVRAKLVQAIEVHPVFCPSTPDKCRWCEVDPGKIEELGGLLAEALSPLPPAPQGDGQEN